MDVCPIDTGPLLLSWRQICVVGCLLFIFVFVHLLDAVTLMESKTPIAWGFAVDLRINVFCMHGVHDAEFAEFILLDVDSNLFANQLRRLETSSWL